MATDSSLDFESLDLRFTVMDDQGNEVELIHMGAEVTVTKENITEYCLRVAKYHLVSAVHEEITAFIEGFYSVIP